MLNWFKEKREIKQPRNRINVGVYYTPKYYCIIACESYFLTTISPDLYEKFIPSDADNLTLGITINEALKKSKFLTVGESKLQTKYTTDSFQRLEKRLLDKRGVKNMNTLYSSMKYLDVTRDVNETVVSPTRREGRGFCSVDESCDITLTNDCLDEVLGEAVYSAIHRWGK